MSETVVRCAAPEVLDEGGAPVVRWTGTVHPAGVEPATVTHRLTSPDGTAPHPSVRPFVLAFLPAAMRIGHPLVVEGELDDVTLDGLAEWQEAMAAWHPGVLRPVPIRAEGPPSVAPVVSAAAQGDRGAITAFSGGVDSCFTAARPRRRPVRAGLMVHGFDIHRDHDEVFASAYRRSARILDGLGIAPLRLHTDVRALEARFPVDWETATHGIWLASALSCFERWFDVAVLPSTYPYTEQQLPWASNPLTDHLLGSASMPLWHDGAAYDKLAKVRALASVEPVERWVRVCWEGDRLDRNCGRCFKCTTTQACFWVAGVPAPRSFEAPASLDDLARTRFPTAYKRSLAERIRAAAAPAGRPDVADAIDRALAA